MSEPLPSYRIAASSDVVKTWNLSSDGTSLHPHSTLNPFTASNARGKILCIRWSHNNQVLACSTDEGSVHLVHESGQHLATLTEGQDDNRPSLMSLAWTTKSKFMATSGVNNRPTLWDLKQKASIRSFLGHSHRVTNVVFTHDDTHLASGDEGGDILLHSVAAESPPTVLRASSPLGALRQMHFFPTRSHLLSGAYHDGSIQIWDTKQGQVVSSFRQHHKGPASCAIVSPINCHLMASAGVDRRLIFMDIDQNKVIKATQVDAPITDMVFYPDGKRIILGCAQGDLLIVDLRKPDVPCCTLNAFPSSPIRSIDVQKPRKDKAWGAGSSNRRNTESGSLSSTPRSKASPRTPGATTTPRGSNISSIDGPPEENAAGAASENLRPVVSKLETADLPPSIDSVSTLSGPSTPASSSKSLPSKRESQSLKGTLKPEVSAVPPLPPPPPSVGALIATTRGSPEVQHDAKLPSFQPEGVKTDFLNSLRQKSEMSESAQARSLLQNGTDGRDTTPGLRGKGGPGESGSTVNHGDIHGKRWANSGDFGPHTFKALSGNRESLGSKASLGFNKPSGQEEKQEISASPVQPGISKGDLEDIVKEALQDFRESMHKDLQNLHLEMLRQFEAQQEDIREALNESFARFARLVEENEALRKENETLRSIY